MTTINRAEAILDARYQTDQMEGDGAANCFDAAAAADALAKEGLLMPDDATTQTETIGPNFPEDEDMPDLPEGTDVTRIVGPWEVTDAVD